MFVLILANLNLKRCTSANSKLKPQRRVQARNAWISHKTPTLLPSQFGNASEPGILLLPGTESAIQHLLDLARS